MYDSNLRNCATTKDSSVISQRKYLYVSYSREEAFSVDTLDTIIDIACSVHRLYAYWVDYACLGETESEKVENLRTISGIIRGATKTLIIIGNGYKSPRSLGWLHWGNRLWSLPELIYSQDISYIVGVNGFYTQSNRRDLSKMVYQWEERDIETKLLYFYSTGYKNVEASITQGAFESLVVLLQKSSLERLTESDLEIAYALMTFSTQTLGAIKDKDDGIRSLRKLNRFDRPIPQKDDRFNDIPVPVGFFCDNLNDLYPREIKVLWRRRLDNKWWSRLGGELKKHKYVAISSEPSEGYNMKLNRAINIFCLDILEIEAFWLALSCFSKDEYASRLDFYHMADVYLRATTTVIVLPDNRKESLQKWADCVWSIAEVLLSSKLYLWNDGNNLTEITKKEVFEKAYGENCRELKLVECVDEHKTMEEREIVARFMDAIWRKKNMFSGTLRCEENSILPTFPAERVYALMALMPVRIFPIVEESETEAIQRLMKANGFGSDFFVWLEKWCQKEFSLSKESHLDHLFKL